MSDQFTMQRADLAKKDKGELQTIIAALGGKSSARAKKDALIDQVLELSGIKPSSDNAQQGLPLDEPAPASPAPTSGEETNDGSNGSAPQPEAATPAAPTTGDDAGRARQAKPRSSGPTAKRAKPDQGATQNGAKQDQAPPHDGPEKAASKTASDAGGTDRQERPKQAKPADSKQNKQGKQETQGDEAGADEEGNRKRRRRGRGRDNVAEDPQVAELVPAAGFLDLHDSGYGFLRVDGHRQSANDVYVAVKMARTLALRKGDLVVGSSRPAQRNEKNPALQQVDTVSGLSVDDARERPQFDDLTPVHPSENLIMEREGDSNVTGQVLDLFAPMAKGQRGLIVAPPRAGKTAMMTEIARSIEANHGEVELFVVQLDERPEEVTKMRRAIPSAEIVASSFGRAADEHTSAVELTMERAKRLAETGKDVVVLIDGLSRLIRAYTMVGQGGGRVSGTSVDAGALFAAKRCFGTACKLEEGGSITIYATISDGVEGSVEQLVLNEFADAANMIVTLDRGLAELGIYPPVALAASRTRDEDLLMDERSAELVRTARQSVLEPQTEDSGAPLVRLLGALDKTPVTEDFLQTFA